MSRPHCRRTRWALWEPRCTVYMPGGALRCRPFVNLTMLSFKQRASHPGKSDTHGQLTESKQRTVPSEHKNVFLRLLSIQLSSSYRLPVQYTSNKIKFRRYSKESGVIASKIPFRAGSLRPPGLCSPVGRLFWNGFYQNWQKKNTSTVSSSNRSQRYASDKAILIPYY